MVRTLIKTTPHAVGSGLVKFPEQDAVVGSTTIRQEAEDAAERNHGRAIAHAGHGAGARSLRLFVFLGLASLLLL